MSDRYDTFGSAEGRFQPGSDDKVLANKLGIINPDEMDDAELILLEELQVRLLDDVESDQRITVADLCNWHRDWLETVYSWAGEFRTVNMQKGEFMFAAANLIPKLMADFDKNYLAKYTPCEGFDQDKLIEHWRYANLSLSLSTPSAKAMVGSQGYWRRLWHCRLERRRWISLI